ncbi:MAG: hypothetical protein AB1758_09910, partial [Candidatus Eremiobacterota bacterium]
MNLQNLSGMGCRILILLGFVLFDVCLGLSLVFSSRGLEYVVGLLAVACGLTLLVGVPLLRWSYPMVWLAAMANAAFPLFVLANAWVNPHYFRGDEESFLGTLFFSLWAVLGVDAAVGLRG